LCTTLGVKHCVMMPNGTLALYAALRVLGIGLGDYVVVPAITMIATPNAVDMTLGYPTMVDIDPITLCADQDRLWQSLKAYPKRSAVIYVSLNGRCGNMDALVDLCKQTHTILIEDAAQSLGSLWHGKALGTFGDVGCFSLSCQKIVSTGNGGFCVTNNDETAEKLRLFKDFGRRKGGGDDYEAFGINLKYTDLQAVVGIEQVKKLPERVARKKAMYALYSRLLKDVKQVRMLPTSEETTPWFVDILAERREDLQRYLWSQDIDTRKMYPALHKTKVYVASHGYNEFPIAEDVAERGLWLPSSPTLSDNDIHRVCDEIGQFYGS
jgi:perosamine synthetase